MNLLKVSLLTGVAFIIGGFFRTGLELILGQQNFFMIFMAIWLGFLTGLFLAKFLDERSGRVGLVLSIT